MIDNANNLVLEHLKRIQARLDNIEREITGLKSAVISSHEVMASFLKNDVRREGDIFSLEQRIARIERRLELNDAPLA
jgi:predicted  nucleic acid-binding Zn-ribbon protein